MCIRDSDWAEQDQDCRADDRDYRAYRQSTFTVDFVGDRRHVASLRRFIHDALVDVPVFESGVAHVAGWTLRTRDFLFR